MAGIVVLLAIACYQVFDLINRLNMMSEGKELTTLFSVVALTSAFKSLVFVCHF